MVEEHAFTPTLIVGVGGTGSKIAEKVYTRACRRSLKEKGRIGVLAFDTDANDRKLRRDLDDRSRIQFASASEVDRILQRRAETQNSWCLPRAQWPMEVQRMSLIDGCGQVRMLSRLALYDSCANKLIDGPIEQAFSELARYDNRAGYDGQVDVLMIGSLAGGTGSGSFLQLALLLGRIAQNKNITTNIRGLFLMPDIYIRSGVAPSGQIPGMLANGYAAFKEFNAVVMKAVERGRNLDFEFEFAPGETMRAGDIPFASMTLIDYENMTGGNLGRSIDAYARMAERAAFTMLFTPIGGRIKSVSVNDIRQTTAAAANGMQNRIVAMGVAVALYPKAEVEDYLAKQLARDSLVGDWLRLDAQFKSRLTRYQSQRAAGNLSQKEPHQGLAYLEDLAQLADDGELPFFREIQEELFPSEPDPSGEPRQPLHIVYLDALEEYMKRNFWNAEELRKTYQRGKADVAQFSSRSALAEEVRRREGFLDEDLRLIDQALAYRPRDIFINLISNADDLPEQEWRLHHLQHHLVRSGPHLVRSRAFLYALQKELEARMAASASAETRSSLMRMAHSQFDRNAALASGRGGVAPTTRSSPAVHAQAAEAAQRGFLASMVRGGVSGFVEDYVSYYNSSMDLTRRFAEERLMEVVHDQLSLELQTQIQAMHQLFQEVEGALERLSQSVAADEERHARDVVDENTLYVCADRACKRALWRDLQEASGGQRLDARANAELGARVYAYARATRLARGRGKTVRTETLGELFWSTMVDRFARTKVKEDYASFYDFSIVAALRKEAEIIDADPAEFIRRVVSIVDMQSQPMISLTEPGVGQGIKFWAITPGVREELRGLGDPERLLSTAEQGADIVQEQEFNPAELLRVSMQVNLELQHLSKLSPPRNGAQSDERSGRYYNAYAGMVDELVEADAERRPATTITPHIHLKWHNPGFLPEISVSETARLVRRVNKAFAAALGLGVLHFDQVDGKPVAEIRTFNLAPIKRGARVQVADRHDLYEALRGFVSKPVAWRSVDELWEYEKSRLDDAFDQTLERISASENLERIVLMAIDRSGGAARDHQILEAVVGYCQLLDEALSHKRRDLSRAAQIRLVEGRLAEAVADVVRRVGEALPNEHKLQIEALLSRGAEIWRAEVAQAA
ncbi:tubulin-like doman-containing protein [Neomegalonema sp.]|uniref:tubulin-like doman-containing protein n=1 Tax=Neomegalonema sp. TaxID=2039713 RepID=UPI002602E8EB|nr:tubulin-like doman-containing protein [Neomegalonema sp.]MDD2867264.1 tubulin-like doman-containing protein [Neomegalonema sp.]